MPVMLTLSITSPAGSTHSINNAHAHSRTASITLKAFTANKCRKPFTPPLLGLPKPSQHAKPIKVTYIICIEPPVDRS